MKITMVQEDNWVVVDGVARKVDLSTMQEVIHALQYDTDTGEGMVEYDEVQKIKKGEDTLLLQDVPIDKADFINQFQKFVVAWEAEK